MVNDSVPIEIGGEKYLLQFTDMDVMSIEQSYRPIHQLFMPIHFGFDMARIFVWKGLKKQQQDGTLIYAFTQDKDGFEKALVEVKKFTGQYNGPAIGLSFIFDLVDAALVASGWYSRAPKVSTTKKEVDPTKKSVRPTKRPMRKLPTESAV